MIEKIAKIMAALEEIFPGLKFHILSSDDNDEHFGIVLKVVIKKKKDTLQRMGEGI